MKEDLGDRSTPSLPVVVGTRPIQGCVDLNPVPLGKSGRGLLCVFRPKVVVVVVGPVVR